MQTTIGLFKQLSQMDSKGVSKIVDVNKFIGKYEKLKLGNGGSWCRFDGKFGKMYKVATIKTNGVVRFSWHLEREEEEKIRVSIDNFLKRKNPQKDNKIRFIKTYGLQNTIFNRQINSNIKKELLKNGKCCVCGSSSDLEIDHKNGFYNDSRLYNVRTQKLSDFQVLCKHCNCQKRQVYKDMERTKLRFDATTIPMLKHFKIKYLNGNKYIDPKIVNCDKGVFWNDPVKFMKTIFEN